MINFCKSIEAFFVIDGKDIDDIIKNIQNVIITHMAIILTIQKRRIDEQLSIRMGRMYIKKVHKIKVAFVSQGMKGIQYLARTFSLDDNYENANLIVRTTQTNQYQTIDYELELCAFDWQGELHSAFSIFMKKVDLFIFILGCQDTSDKEDSLYVYKSIIELFTGKQISKLDIIDFYVYYYRLYYYQK